MHIRFGGTSLNGPGLAHTYSLTDTSVERGQGVRLACCRYTRAVIKDAFEPPNMVFLLFSLCEHELPEPHVGQRLTQFLAALVF